MNPLEVYLDNSATTRVDDDAAAAALEIWHGAYGNPSSLHKKGMEAQLRLETARRQLAGALGCRPEEVVFTGGGTESNNLALLGAAAALRRRGNTLVASSAEHASVLAPLRHLERQGMCLRLVDPGPGGHIEPGRLLEAVDGDTVLVSCMLVNSEVGAVSPIADIAAGLRRKNATALLHCDAVQAFGKLPFTAARLGADLVSVSGHKLHAPKGVGALYIRRGARIRPLVHGGGQENGLRPGTENVALACAMGHAAEKAAAAGEHNRRHVAGICEYFVKKLGELPGACINSPPDATPYICNISLPGYRSEILLHALAARGVYVSSGSACAKGQKSHVLQAMGLPPRRVDSALRVSFSRDTTAGDIDRFFQALAEVLAQVLPA